VVESAPRKATTHRALDDIRESVGELRWYRQQLFRPSVRPVEAPGPAPA
jgi:oligoribonuclease